MYKLLICLQCLSLRSATTLLQFIMFAVVIGLCTIVLHVNATFMDGLISEISDKLLFKQNFIQYELQTNLLKYQANWPMTKRYKMMSTFSDIYLNLMPRIYLQKAQEPLQCPLFQGQSFSQFNTLFNLPQFCVTKLQTNEEQAFYPFLNTMDQLIIPLTYSPVTEFFFTNIEGNHFFASNPPIFDFPNYQPQLRPWYINHMNQSKYSNRTEFVSNLYQSYGQNDYSFTITYSLYSNQLDPKNPNSPKMVAVMGYDSSFDEYSQQFKFSSLSYFILNVQGQIILTNQYQELNLNFSANVYLFSNFSITGFDYQDWIQVQNSALSLNYTNNCHIEVNHLCRFNTKHKEDIILHVLNLNSDFYLVIFQNVTMQQENIQYAEDIKLDIIRSFSRQLLYLVLISIALLFITLLGMYLFFRPIKYLREILIEQINNKFFNNNSMQQFQRHLDENKSSYLKQALKILKTKITDINYKKCLNCYLIENFRYPINNKSTDIFRIIAQSKLIQNDQNYGYKFQEEVQTEVNKKEIFQSLINQRNVTNPTLFSESDENIQMISDSGTSRLF